MTPDNEAMPPNPIYCADYSQASGEPLIGSATQTDGYILLENNESWGEKALEDSQIAKSVKDYLKSYTKDHPTVKVLLTRAPRPFVTPGLHCFVASTQEQQQALYSFQLNSYENLLDLDFSAIFAGDPAYETYHRETPLILVCTNGRRDYCCARQGVVAINALVSLTHENTEAPIWHSSHMGGHRFAANVLCLPHGLLYGRVGLEQASAIWEACQNEQIYLPNLRGRTCYPPVVQAADHYLRTRMGLTVLQALRWVDAEETAADEWRVRFMIQNSGETVAIQVRAVQTKTQVFESCHLDKTVPVVTYEFSE